MHNSLFLARAICDGLAVALALGAIVYFAAPLVLPRRRGTVAVLWSLGGALAGLALLAASMADKLGGGL